MKRKRHTPQDIIAKLREAEVDLNQGATIEAVSRKLEISEQTFHRWRHLYGGMKEPEMARMKELLRGRPWENGYSESFNSRMKTEFVNREVFGSLLEAKILGADYQRYWNQERLHSGIGYKTPAQFAAELGPDSATLRPPQVRSPHQTTLISTGT